MRRSMSEATPTEFPKRFYKQALVAEIEDGWTVELDGRGLKTPEKVPLNLPTKALAEAVAQEWGSQQERIHIASMHLTRLANVAIDRTPQNREGMAEELARYCQTDLLCHLAGSPQESARSTGCRVGHQSAYGRGKHWGSCLCRLKV